jgi:hypothetical protein
MTVRQTINDDERNSFNLCIQSEGQNEKGNDLPK